MLPPNPTNVGRVRAHFFFLTTLVKSNIAMHSDLIPIKHCYSEIFIWGFAFLQIDGIYQDFSYECITKI